MKYFALILLLCVSAVCRGQVRWHDEQRDTVRLTELLTEAAALPGASPSDRVGFLARKFVGTPYVAHTLEGAE